MCWFESGALGRSASYEKVSKMHVRPREDVVSLDTTRSASRCELLLRREQKDAASERSPPGLLILHGICGRRRRARSAPPGAENGGPGKSQGITREITRVLPIFTDFSRLSWETTTSQSAGLSCSQLFLVVLGGSH